MKRVLLVGWLLLATSVAMAESIEIDTAARRQVIDGFGGSIAFWGTSADQEALRAGIKDLDVTIVRAQGEVSPTGNVEQNRDILQRAMKLNPELQVLLTFWQPRSVARQKKADWLNVVEVNGSPQYVLKPEMKDAWASEMVSRIKQYLDWGINVTTVGVQNESNWSHTGTQTCRWEPEQLRDFIEQNLKPKLETAGIKVTLAAPDFAYIGHNASEVGRFLPTLTSSTVDIVAYHMYDSFNDTMEERGMAPLERNTRALAAIRQENFSKKRLWMTETTGAQWNSNDWHTYGWSPTLSEHGKAIKAARYIHTTLVDAEANAFLWWGLVYSLAPANQKDPNARQKHRDEGLVLVRENYVNGVQPFLERTKKFYTFRQFSAFVKPGDRRIATAQPEGVQLSAYVSSDGMRAVAIAINDTKDKKHVALTVKGMKKPLAWQTDRKHNCEPVDPREPMPPMSVRSWVWESSD